ncbi:MAG: hypothetical protein EOO89_23615 [Pedobacter sp.]|nr:MAG: hypothetical protein EOO89_23615 [Pedobacter sp.]
MSFQSSVQQARVLNPVATAYLAKANAIKPVENLDNVVDVHFGDLQAQRKCRVCDAIIPWYNNILLISRCCSVECQDRVIEMNQAKDDYWPDDEVEEIDQD